MSESVEKDKTSVFDLIVAALRHHEERLDLIVEKMEKLVEAIGKQQTTVHDYPTDQMGLIDMFDWTEFKERATQSESIAFDLGENFSVYSASRGKIYKYSEPLLTRQIQVLSYPTTQTAKPTMEGTSRLRCGLEYDLKRGFSVSGGGAFVIEARAVIEVEKARRWLANNLGIGIEKVSFGKITI